MRAQAKILKNHPVFSRFSARTINRLSAHAQVREFPKGAVVYRTGDPAEAMYVILSGRCQAQVLLPDGSDQVLDVYAPGDTFGERALVSGDRHWATVKVITDSVLLRIDGQDVNDLFDRSPKLARELVLRMVDQLKAYREEEHADELGRVVTLVQVTERVPAHVVAENIAAALAMETGSSVLYVELLFARGHSMLLDWPQLEGQLGEQIMRAGRREADRLVVHVGDDEREVEVPAPLISELARRYHYVLILAPVETPAPVVLKFVEQADMAHVLFGQRPDDLYKANLLLRQVQNFSETGTDVLPTVCLDYQERARPFVELNGRLGREVRHVIHGLSGRAAEDPRQHYARSQEGRFSSHIRRVAREIGRCQVGLALSSGGAKGFAYVGIIQALEEHGIHIDVVVGTSMGAYVGALWSHGLTGDQMEVLALAMEKHWAFFRLIDPVIPPRRGFMRGNKIRRLLMESIGDDHFSDMVRQLRVVATDLDTLERVVFDSGEVAPAVHASLAMPGVFVPVKLDGRTIIDGGIADPLPVDVLIEMGVERIIAANTILTPDAMRSRVEMGREVAALQKKEVRAASALGRFVNYFAPGNILDIMMRGIHGAQTRVAEGSCKQADVVLRPVAPDGKWHDFASARRYVELGREVTVRQIDEIRALAGGRR